MEHAPFPHNLPITTTLYTEVAPFFEALIEGITGAKERVSMMYFAFDHGVWAEKIAEATVSARARGVRVRLMVDELGLVLDNPINAVQNRFLLDDLRRQGIEVCQFSPKGHRLNRSNRLHVKVCAIDETLAFIGGSNIGDHYLEWSDHNFEMRGKIGDVFHDVFDYLDRFTGHAPTVSDIPHLSQLRADDAQVWLTVPKQRRDVRRALLDLILDADKEVNVRTWYFIPDNEILDALHSQASNGVLVRILLSDRTKIRLIDVANPSLAEDLTKAGAKVYRYTESFMHSKAAWNNNGEVLFGSANLDGKAMASNFELSVFIKSPTLASELTSVFDKDCGRSRLHQIGDFASQPLAKRALARLFKLASPWL